MSEISDASLQPVHQCQHCNRQFRRENSLVVHMCEQKRRHCERNEVGVQLGLNCYLRFYEITQGSSKLKTWDDFATSAYYKAFVRFGRYCQSIRAVNTARFTDWLIAKNVKLDRWCSDRVYSDYLQEYVRTESVADALSRAIEHSLAWADSTGCPAQDFLKYANPNAVAHAVSTGRITAWILYNCDSGHAWLEAMNDDHRNIVWPWIDPEFWQRKFRDYPADQEYAREILQQARW